MRIRRDDNVASSLAFIDVMACGLGAVILLFFIVDFDDHEPIEAQAVQIPTVEEPAVQSDVGKKTELVASIAGASRDVAQLQIALSDSIVGRIAQQMKADAITQSAAQTESVSKERIYSGDLIGLKINGSKILILFDVSASMSEEKLIDIILGTSDPSGSRLAQGSKWIVARNVLQWVVDNAPEQSDMKLISFSDEAKLHTDQWVTKSNLRSMLHGILVDLRPDGGTRLGSGLRLAADRAGDADTVYVITDGLPTLKGKGTSLLKQRRSCGLRGNGYVSGDCREAYFKSAVSQYTSKTNAQVSIILLPLEGDPKAAPLYWWWATQTGGILFSPAQGWP